MEVGESVFVQTPNFEGAAKIMFIHAGEIWPVQIELDRPDADGHKVYRVDYAEVMPADHPGELMDDGSIIYPNANPDAEPYIEQPGRFFAKVARHRNGYRIGDEYIISRPGANGFYHVYLKSRPRTPVGSYITDFFEIIGPYDEPKNDIPLKRTETAQIEAQPVLDPKILPGVKTKEITQEPGLKITKVWIKKPKEEKQKKKKLSVAEKLEQAGQLNIFDFLGGE